MALLYPNLITIVGDAAHPSWRATGLGVYRMWRDAGYGFGAILIGVTADLMSIQDAFYGLPQRYSSRAVSPWFGCVRHIPRAATTRHRESRSQAFPSATDADRTLVSVDDCPLYNEVTELGAINSSHFRRATTRMRSPLTGHFRLRTSIDMHSYRNTLATHSHRCNHVHRSGRDRRCATHSTHTSLQRRGLRRS
jgi:hypothetical protein